MVGNDAGLVRSRCLVCVSLVATLMAGASATGALIPDWTARHHATTGFLELVLDVAADRDGNVYVTGATGHLVDTDVLTIKYTPDGTAAWVAQHVGGAGREFGAVVLVDGAGDVIVVGRVGSDFGVIKYDPGDGSEIWSVQHDAGGTDQPNAAAIDPAGNIYVTGQSWVGSEENDFYTIKLDSGGNLQWAKRYAHPGGGLFQHDVAVAIGVDANGDVFVTGPSNRANTASEDYATIKYRGSNGAQLWLSRYEGIGINDIATALAVGEDGDVFVTGASFQNGWMYATIRYNGADGSVRWVALDDPGTHDRPAAIKLDSHGDVYVTGRSDPDGDDNNFNEDIVTVKHRAADGARQWLTRFGSPAVGAYDLGHDLIIDSEDNVFVVGENSGLFVLFHYDPGTGAELARDTINSGPNEYASGRTLALDGSQNVLAAAVARNVNTENRDILTLKYPSQVTAIPGDCDEDGDVDLDDFECFLGCYSGPGGGVPADCGMFDFDQDNDVDFGDYQGMQQAFTGSMD